ncbi:glycoside hydrolase family 19 protein [Caballeronia telluris]|uniref:Glycoside hydrolase family protein n=1 Tax=Caballeronia telluris TaxID=326475 RepID=A0A158G0G0_9BURK|nr:glycoside hydrolase family 19 protein [Caballeronia telluris]SAL25512.1 glycoside hydrolase family protein [Caballeronia telluris]
MNLTSSIVAASSGAAQLRAAQWLPHLQAACDRFAINTPRRVAAFFPQIGHESGGLVYMKEIWGPTPAQARYEGRADLGNTQAGDGKRFMGRGLIQITGRRNYQLASIGLDLDLITHPELLEQPANAAMSAAWWWTNHYLNGYADVGQFDRITRIINGGTNGAAQRLALYGAAKHALGIV